MFLILSTISRLTSRPFHHPFFLQRKCSSKPLSSSPLCPSQRPLSSSTTQLQLQSQNSVPASSKAPTLATKSHAPATTMSTSSLALTRRVKLLYTSTATPTSGEQRSRVRGHTRQTRHISWGMSSIWQTIMNIWPSFNGVIAPARTQSGTPTKC